MYNKERVYWPKRMWLSKDPEDLGINPRIESDLNRFVARYHSNIYGIMLVYQGYVIHEKYYHRKTDKDFFNVASVTKSVTSALTGIAFDQGYLKDLHQPVLSFFPEYINLSGNKTKEKATLFHLLTMTAPFPFKPWKEPLGRLRKQENWLKYALDMLGQSGRLGSFKYSTAGTQILSAIITRATGRSLRIYANEHLFKKIGMREIKEHPNQGFSQEAVFGKSQRGWVHDPQGLSAGGFGLTLSLEDMARFGYLYLNEGQWNGESILSSSWIESSTRVYKNNYGYLWWIKNLSGIHAYAALGTGGNMIAVLPEKDLVIAISSKVPSNPWNRWSLIEKVILPYL